MFLFLSPLTFFGLPLFLFLFLCLSLSLVFLLPSCLSFCFLLVSCFCLFSFFFLLCFCFMKRTTWKCSIAIYFFPELFSLSFGFLYCFFFPIPFSYLCFFLILSYVLFNINVWGFKKQSWKTAIFGQKGSCNKPGFFLWTRVLENVKSYRLFLPMFLPNFGWCSKKHYKNRYFSTILKTKKCILRCYYLGQVGVIIWPMGQVDCNLKMANLAQIITPQICTRNFFSNQNVLKPHIFILFFLTNSVL